MRTENKKIVWHDETEQPSLEFCSVLVRVIETTDPTICDGRVYYKIWQWLGKENKLYLPCGFYEDGNAITARKHASFSYLRYEWTYLTDEDADTGAIISIF